MSNSTISIIVPIYMVDRYVGLCIESILNQSYEDLEIILVDDGSKDRSGEICDLYAGKDPRIKVIHKKNGGLVSARQAGIRESNGKYIAYVDGDDWIESDFIEILHATGLEDDSDIVCAGYTRDLFEKSTKLVNTFDVGCYEQDTLLGLWRNMISYREFFQPGIKTYVWNKLFKRNVVLEAQALVDTRITIGEDAAVTYPALLKCKRVSVTNNTSYHYRQREDSMLKKRESYLQEAKKLKHLTAYMSAWSQTTNPCLEIQRQVNDYILANAIMRSGGLPKGEYSAFGTEYYGKNIVIYNAGTFGQQLVSRFRENGHCNIVAWVDDDFWQYRRCCLDVNPIASLSELCFDYILIAKVGSSDAQEALDRLMKFGIEREKILTVKVPEDKEQLIMQFLNVGSLTDGDEGESYSHA